MLCYKKVAKSLALIDMLDNVILVIY